MSGRTHPPTHIDRPFIDGLQFNATKGAWVNLVCVLCVCSNSGRRRTMPRRDLRRGVQSGFAEDVGDGGVRVSFDWGDPAPGTLQELYTLQVRGGGCRSCSCFLYMPASSAYHTAGRGQYE